MARHFTPEMPPPMVPRLAAMLAACWWALMGSAAAQDAGALARQTQNPIASLISVPFQNNFNFGVGPGDHLQYILNIQPVIPMGLGPRWNWIHRTIVPLIYQPSLGGGLGNTFGLGDVQYQGFLSPAAAGPSPGASGRSSSYNVERPTGGPDWQIRLQFQLLFPRGAAAR